jgi:hypothetical protein
MVCANYRKRLAIERRRDDRCAIDARSRAMTRPQIVNNYRRCAAFVYWHSGMEDWRMGMDWAR